MTDPAQPAAPGAGPEGGPEGAGGPPGQPPNLTSNRRLQQTQAQVEEVVDIIRVNVDKVLERDQKLSELDERADALQAGAQVFESSAAALKRKYWWKNCKMMIMLGVICAIVVIAIAHTTGGETLYKCLKNILNERIQYHHLQLYQMADLMILLSIAWYKWGNGSSARPPFAFGRTPRKQILGGALTFWM